MRKEYKEMILTDDLALARKEKAAGNYVVLCYPLMPQVSGQTGGQVSGQTGGQEVRTQGCALCEPGTAAPQAEISQILPSPGEFPYAIEDVWELDGLEEGKCAYLDRILCRMKGLPCHILDTPHFRVREIKTDDLDALYEIYAQPGITDYIEDLFENKEDEIAYTQQYIRYQYGFYDFGMWIVEDARTGEIVGRAGFDMREGFEIPELGYMLRTEYQHQGYAYEICNHLISYGREELAFEAVGALTDAGNTASVRLLERLGFVFDRKVKQEKDGFAARMLDYYVAV